jgi:hypothetical protein
MMKKFLLAACLWTGAAAVNAQTPSEPPLEDYTGKYVFPEGSVVPEVDVTITDGALFMTSVAGSSVCTRLSVDSFQIVEFSGIAFFKRGDDKKVNAVHIEAMGYVLDGQKKSDGSWRFTFYYRTGRELLVPKK